MVVNSSFTNRSIVALITKKYELFRPLLRRSLRLGQREQEPAALAGRAFGPDSAAVLLHDTAAQREPQPRSSQRARIGRIALLKAVEDVLQLFGRNPPT